MRDRRPNHALAANPELRRLRPLLAISIYIRMCGKLDPVTKEQVLP